jgi:hypothetical protein
MNKEDIEKEIRTTITCIARRCGVKQDEVIEVIKNLLKNE